MNSGDIVLQYGLKEGHNADATVAADSLLAWIDVVRDAARAIDPNADIRVELLGREEGSLRQLLRLVDDQVKLVSDGAADYPYLKKVAIGLAAALATTTLSVFVQEIIEPEVQVVELSAPDRKILTTLTEQISSDASTSRAATRFFRAIERDPAITEVVLSDGSGRTPMVRIDRSQFAMRGGLYSPEEEAQPAEETRTDVWSVVLLQAPFYVSERHWAFSRDGIRFSARVVDAAFLQAIVDKTIPINLQEGVTMEVAVEWKERLNGKVWEMIPDSRRIVRVLSPRPMRPTPTPD